MRHPSSPAVTAAVAAALVLVLVLVLGAGAAHAQTDPQALDFKENCLGLIATLPIAQTLSFAPATSADQQPAASSALLNRLAATAEAGSVADKYSLGVIYESGNCTQRNPDLVRAAAWFRAAATQAMQRR